MNTHTYKITETATYKLKVELPDGMDPDSDEARDLAEQEFCAHTLTELEVESVEERAIERTTETV